MVIETMFLNAKYERLTLEEEEEEGGAGGGVIVQGQLGVGSPPRLGISGAICNMVPPYHRDCSSLSGAQSGQILHHLSPSCLSLDFATFLQHSRLKSDQNTVIPPTIEI
ncbi:Uncharacterized protein Fot_35563 [Forsythia ovata]|uniref:Uncharacterized protein n=1 Tax=Forsythia ovata TaxID=205694 RepID=A0ABD1SLW3_9LAMI